MNQPNISVPYLLVLFSVPFMRNAKNELCVFDAWGKDLIQHAAYIDNLTLAACISDEAPPNDVVVVENHPALKNVRFVLLPKPKSTLHAIKLLPKTLSILWKEVGVNKIIHSGVGSWPIPEAWMICPMLLIKKRLHIIIVESAFWRIPIGQTASISRKVKASIWEFINRLCVQHADLSIFTQEDYKKSLLGKYQQKGFVIPATWVDAENILADNELNALIEQKEVKVTQPIKLIFAGRLVFEKGILLLIKATSELIDSGYPLSLDIYGDGSLLKECADLIKQNQKTDSIHLRGTVKYGPEFFNLLHHYDLMVIPSLSDEQPRNVFDAFSQALPVLCSDTAGLLQCVENQKTGYFFKTGDSAELKTQLIHIISNRHALLNMSGQCVHYVREMTHTQMHMKRLKLINQALSSFE